VCKEQRIVVDFLLEALPAISLIYLFGSRVDSSHSENSDWDIAVLSQGELANIERWEIAQALAAELNADVDLIDLYCASTVMQKQIIDTGTLLFEKENASAKFDMKVLSMYARLEDSRADLIEVFVKGVKNAGK